MLALDAKEVDRAYKDEKFYDEPSNSEIDSSQRCFRMAGVLDWQHRATNGKSNGQAHYADTGNKHNICPVPDELMWCRCGLFYGRWWIGSCYSRWVVIWFVIHE